MGSVYQPKDKQVLYISFKNAAGKWKSKSTGIRVAGLSDVERNKCERRAQAMLDTIEARIAAGAELSGGGPLTLAHYAQQWFEERQAQGVATAADEEGRMRNHVLPELGDTPLSQIRPRHVRDLVRALRRKTSARGTLLAPRTVRHVYATLRRMLQDAVVDELIDANPCVLKRNELPAKVDQDATWRSGAVFVREEVQSIIGHPRIPEDRRTLYALAFLGALRFGEAAALRWRAYDAAVEPLGKLLIACAYNAKTRTEAPVKTKVPREMPAHPALAAVLAAWKRGGFERTFGRPPRPDDLIVPSRRGNHRNVNHGLRRFHQDLERIGLRPRRIHDLRRTFITLARADGARPDILRWATHGPTGDIVDLYTSLPWAALCEEVAKLKIEPPGGRVIPLPTATARTEARGDLLPSYSRSRNRARSQRKNGGADGTRTRGLRRDRPAL